MSGVNILGAVYDRITESADAVNRLAVDPLTGNPAVYDTWATDEIGPYIVMGFEAGEPDGRLMGAARVSLDLFDRRPTVQSRVDLWELRDHLVSLFDRYMAIGTGGAPRFFIANDEPIDEDDGKMRGWRVSINVRYGRI